MAYKGLENLRSAGEEVEVTAEQMQEIMKCIMSIQYFATHYCYINNVSLGRILIPLYDFQKELLSLMAGDSVTDDKYNVIIRSARQTGKCIVSDTQVTVRDRITNELRVINIGELLV